MKKTLIELLEQNFFEYRGIVDGMDHLFHIKRKSTIIVKISDEIADDFDYLSEPEKIERINKITRYFNTIENGIYKISDDENAVDIKIEKIQ
ncbi:MAG: hypothetical protein FWG80_01710 [Alphaproteobacteria bacterium]|nr:hypothetical protein [Alphaproteobacteria bacterium]